MKAVYIQEYGGAEQLILGELPKPSIKANQVLIKVKATSVNPVDWMVRDGFMQDSGTHELPLVLGWDVSGDIVELGQDVDNCILGDAVFAYAPIVKQGAYAEYIAIDSDLVAPKPESLTAITAAAVPLAATTAWQALVQGCQLKAGDKVLIHNASGGVGSFAVQIAKALGAYVIGTASGAKQAFVKSLGVDEFIDYQTQNFEDMELEVDAVLAAVGGDNILQRSTKVLKHGGHLVSLLDDIDNELQENTKFNAQRWWVSPNANDLKSITSLIDSDKVKIHTEQILPIEKVAEAHALSQSKRVKGKLVLTLS